MCLAIDNPASYEIRAVFRFLHARNVSAAEIRRQPKIMSEGTVRQLYRMLKDGRINVHDEERSGRPSIFSEW
jgi:hypothetical protein